ncbi:PRD domain-containing protein [Roseburia sp. AF12-17LB]|uniref:BglG family transcription antiterminator LicT n=1 Tax=unclassified Roseburia TaxID=2637578 RepID=UPI000E4ED265|nr:MULTISPECIES: PRD domain-containing protein [unclassified Roseburia]RGF57883.1 PRD domain-containing protein [Roseburia sp. AF34-16]RHS23690.1 PRD domain-containing protein [Roseburia sp. AF12-17LB]
MQIIKVINNNVISSEDDKGKEIVVMGKGIGFGKKAGEEIEETKIEKVFSLPDESTSQFMQVVKDMSYEYIRTAELVIAYARETLGYHLSKNIYVTLTDHLGYAIERKRQGIVVANELSWEMKKFYNAEFQVGLKALDIVKQELDVELPEDEAGFIAMHLVNAQMGGQMNQSRNMPAMIKDILNIVRYTFQVELDEKSLSYERFVTHLRFFVQRVISREDSERNDEEFDQLIADRFPRSYECAQKIKSYMKKKLDYEVSDVEISYLAVHIHRVIHSMNK